MKAYLCIESTNGCTIEKTPIEVDPKQWKKDKEFMEKLREYHDRANSLSYKWQVEGEDESAFICVIEDHPEDEVKCFVLNDEIDDFFGDN